MGNINLIAAHNGGIKVYGDKGPLGWATAAADLAGIIERHGLAGTVWHSSSMDFADEEGFDNHLGAWKLWNAALVRNAARLAGFKKEENK